jgi:ACS family 4-hydroxyphenylacetate permease-like MFS transporter
VEQTIRILSRGRPLLREQLGAARTRLTVREFHIAMQQGVPMRRPRPCIAAIIRHTMPEPAEALPVSLEAAAYRKVFRRVVWYLFVLYICSYLDRINIGFAALAMNRDLGLTPTTFGIANTVFYLGYMAFEVPSNLMLARFGARTWLARIMITWGIASTATAFATGATSLYVLRLLVGVAEAGFVPGVLLYLTYWFPQAYRARANGLFMVAQPLTIASGSVLSGYILGMNGALGVAGWRWLFVLEGVPSIVLGVFTFFYLKDGPRDAWWLSAGERNVIEAHLAAERAPASSRGSVWAELRSRDVVLLCLAYFGLVSTLNTNATWVPQIVREILGGQRDFVTVGVWAAIPALLTVAAMPIWSLRSDRRQERLWHVTIPMAMAAAGWLFVTLASAPLVRFAGLALVSIGGFCGMSIFWTLPATLLSRAARPAGIALISTAGIFGSAVSPSIIGFLRDQTGTFTSGLLYMVALLVVSIACVWASARAWQPDVVGRAEVSAPA